MSEAIGKMNLAPITFVPIGGVTFSKGSYGAEVSLLFGLTSLRKPPFEGKSAIYSPFLGASMGWKGDGSSYYEWEYAQPLLAAFSSAHSFGGMFGIVGTIGSGIFLEGGEMVGRQSTYSMLFSFLFPTPIFYYRTFDLDRQDKPHEIGIMLKFPLRTIKSLI